MINCVPVLLGGDLNAYSMAMSFADAYGIPSYVLARDRLGISATSPFVRYGIVNGLDKCDEAVGALDEIASRHRGERLLLVPCADWYMEMLEYARDVLRGRFYFNVPSFECWRTVSDKASFAALMEKFGIPHPVTAVIDRGTESVEETCGSIKPPFVVKPSDSTEYWRHPFNGMRKTYFAYTLSEARDITRKIFGSGYNGKVIVQEFFGGSVVDGASASVLTTYSDSSGHVVRAVLGDVLLEDRTATATGNYSAIVTRALDGISRSLIGMLESIGYTGFANFDILHCGKKSVCLELNPRQGRSFDYIRIAGMSAARLLVTEMNGGVHGKKFEYGDGVWSAVPWRTLKAYAKDRDLYERAEALKRAGMLFSPYKHKYGEGIKRKLYVAVHLRRESNKYKKAERGNADAFE